MMQNSKVDWKRKLLAILLAQALLPAGIAAQEPTPPSANDPGIVFRSKSELVLVNVTVRDASGDAVRDLKREDFTVLEENRPQPILSFDLENTDLVALPEARQASLLSSVSSSAKSAAANSAPAVSLKDHRLILLFFDLSSMQPEEIDRAITAAQNYVRKQMTAADLVSVISLGNSLTVNQDFTSDRELLAKTLNGFTRGSAAGFEAGTTGTTDATSDNSQPFTADDTEYNIFNVDRRLQALQQIAQALDKVDQKKSMLYFSGGMDRTGIENQSQLRAATNAAVRANLAIYTMDARGLQAIVPGGEAQSGSLRGASVYSGRATVNAFDSNATSQETLVTLAGDTGGKAFLDTNDFAPMFTQVQRDSSSYYIIGYHSSNPARDGRYRKITVKLNRPGLKLNYRKGYYAPADFQHSNQEDRERQLDEELAADFPSTDLPVYLAASYFRVGDNRFYVPVSLLVPGSEIPFVSSSQQDKASLDVLGVATDENKRPAGQLRDTVKLAVNTSQQVKQKNVQYNNGMMLPSGKYHLKFVLRENQTGRIGSFETDITIPELKSAPKTGEVQLKLSSVVLANQIQAAGKKRTDNPLVRDGSELIPSVTRVFSSAQHLYFYYEVYDPAKESSSAAKAVAANDTKAAPAVKGGIRLLSNVAFFQGNTKIYESPSVELREMNSPDRRAAAFQLDVPLSQLKPGFYTCQVNVVDDAAGRFAFPRITLLVRPQVAVPGGSH